MPGTMSDGLQRRARGNPFPLAGCREHEGLWQEMKARVRFCSSGP